MTTLYPRGYATQLVPLDELIRIYHPKMHPEFSRRLFAWLESMGGQIGIGSGWRAIQPDKPGVAPEGKSFHQDQTFASGFVGYAAVDLVARNPGGIHRAPTWPESSTGPLFGVHTFIKNPPEPWHMQPIEMRGWQTWVNAGRLDPPRWKPEEDDMVPLPIPERVYDSREKGGLFAAGETRKIPVGMCRSAFVHVTAISTLPGYVSISGTDAPSPASLVNLDADGIASGGAPIGLPDGHVRVQASAACHIVVDVFARGG